MHLFPHTHNNQAWNMGTAQVFLEFQYSFLLHGLGRNLCLKAGSLLDKHLQRGLLVGQHLPLFIDFLDQSFERSLQ